MRASTLSPAAPAGRMSLRRPGRRSRLILLLLVAATVLRGVAWVAAMPPWQGPDEPSHYAYVSEVAHGELRPTPASFAASEAVDASVARSAWAAYQHRSHERPMTREQLDRITPEPRGLDDRVPQTVAYPPLSYVLLAPFYHVPGQDTATARLYAVRLGGVLFGAALVVVAFLLIRELVDDDRWALAGAALLSLLPLVSHASAVVNPDLPLTLFTGFLALACVRVAVRGASWARLAGVVAAAAAVVMTKPVGLPLAALVAGTVVGVPFLARRTGRLLPIAVAFVPACLVALGAVAYVRSGLDTISELRFAGSYLWQFYLPKPGWQASVFDAGLLSDPVPAWPIWGKMTIGWFGWNSVQLAGWVYELTAGCAGLAVAFASVQLLRSRRALPATVSHTLAALGLTVVGFVLVLHAAEIDYMLLYPGERLLQGRYLLPVVPPAVVLVVAGLQLAGRWGFRILLGLVAVAFLVSVAALNSVLVFYAG